MTVPEPLSTASVAPARPVDTVVSPNARFALSPARYPKVHVHRGVGIRMSDGVILSADVTRPADRNGNPAEEPLPAVVSFTAYNKTMLTRAARLIDLVEALGPSIYRFVAPSSHGRHGRRELLRAFGGGGLDAIRASRTLIARGYVHVAVDVRGTGSSTGRLQLFTEREQQDTEEVLEWVRQQPWCNGDLAMHGPSYLAISALHAAARRPEGLKAVFALVPSADLTRDLMINGGVQSVFTIGWLAAVTVLKWLPTVPGLIRTRALVPYLRDRLASPATRFGHAVGVISSPTHREHFYNDDSRLRCPRIEDITAATWIHTGWHDVFAHSATQIYDRLRLDAGARQLVVDDSFHGSPGTGFGTPGFPQRLDELQCAFFDRWVKGLQNGIDRYGPVTIRQQGGGWASRTRFPHPDATPRIWHLSSRPSGSAGHAATDGSLSAVADTDSARIPLPRRRPRIASQTTSWCLGGVPTVLGKSWSVDDRRYEAAAATFTTDPFTDDLVVSGPINLHLRVVTSGTDAFWAVTVCDVAPDGTSTVIARGALRSSRRAIDESASTRVDGNLLAAHHRFDVDSVLPVEPGVPHELDIYINPTEAVLGAGHRLRVAITRTSWPRYYLTPRIARRMRKQEIVLDPSHPSWLALLGTAQPRVTDVGDTATSNPA